MDDDAPHGQGDGFPPPAVGWASGPLGEAQVAHRRIARETAARFRKLAAFAATRPASADRRPGEKGAMSADRRAARPEVLADVSEWAAQEVAIAFAIPTRTAEIELARALTVVRRLPRTLEALESGLLHQGHLWPMLDKVATVADAAIRARLEADLLAWVGRRHVTTPAQLGAKIRRELLARNVRDAARDLEEQLRRRGVYVQADRVDGMATLCALLTVPEAAALVEALGAYADALVDDPAAGPPRSRQQKMADCLLDLVLRPGESDLPVVRADVTVVAPVATMVGGDQPAEVGGDPVPAEMARALAQGLGLLPAPADDGPPDGACPAGSFDDLEFDADPATHDSLLAAADEAWWAEVEARVARGEWGGEDDPPPDELERLWAETARELADDPHWALLFGFVEDDDEPVPMRRAPGETSARGPSPGDTSVAAADDGGAAAAAAAEPSWWAAADAAVDAAGAAQLAVDRALNRAQRAVDAAERADRADRDAWEESAAARISAAPDALTALAHATADRRAALGALLQRTAGGGLADRPRIALTDALTGALLALTDAPGLRAAATCGARACRTGRRVCDHDLTGRPGLGPPPECDTYRPGAALDRFLRARDRRCRQPGCRGRVPRGGELDHNVAYPDGPTAAQGMVGFCTGHHRGKHQAPGWRYDLSAEGTLTVTTPTGMVASTDPPPF
ncbi:DUF222 domain-containing protein [Blastococcus jejuensis]